MSGLEEDPEADVRERVRMLAAWAERELELSPSAFKGCTSEEVDRLRVASAVDHLPAAYDEFLLVMGHGGVGSSLFDIFPGEDVAWESMMPGEEWPGGRGIAEAIIHEGGYDVELAGNYVVVHTHRDTDIEYVPVGEPDPAVWAMGDTGHLPHQVADSFTDWLEHLIGRAIKRRYPLRDARFAVG